MKWENCSDPDKIVGYALAIRQVTRALEPTTYELLEKEQMKGERDTKNDDSLFLPGLIVSSVVLTALSAELILKAWLGKLDGKYPKTHNFEVLMGELGSSLWAQFEDHEATMIQTSLIRHADDFTHWRYLFENVDAGDSTKHPDSAMLKTVELLIQRYRDKWMRRTAT